MPQTNTVRGIYSDLRKIFDIQFQEFVQQFINNKTINLEQFFTDADANSDFLDDIINKWCEQGDGEQNIKTDLDAAAAIFLMAFIDKVDKETVSEQQVVDSPLG